MSSRTLAVVLVGGVVAALAWSAALAVGVAEEPKAPAGEVAAQATPQPRAYLPLIAKYYPGYFDDFSSTSSGWTTKSTHILNRSYLEGEYEIEIFVLNSWGGAAAPGVEVAANYALEADARRLDGITSYYGLIFDQPNWLQFYVFAVWPDSANPSYRLFRYLRKDGQDIWTALTAWTPSNAINRGSAANRLKVVRQGVQIQLYVNGALLQTVSDTSYAYAGNAQGVGLFAAAPESSSNTIIRFDNFLATGQVQVTGAAALSQEAEGAEGSQGGEFPSAPAP